MKRSQRRLRQLFEAVTTAALATACGGSSSGSSGAVDPSEWPEALCDGQTYLAVHGLNAPVDYVDLRKEYTYSNPQQQPTILDQDGRACFTASDHLACGKTFNQMTSKAGWSPPSFVGAVASVEYLVTTKGDAVTTVTTDAELKAFLGTIDNIKKAALVYTLSGQHTIACGTTRGREAQGGGYDFINQETQPCGGSFRVVNHVASDGTLSEVSRVQLTPAPTGPCGTGRRPEGLAPRNVDHGTGLGAFFAEVARLEAASVHAFRRLAKELRAHGAPRSLMRRAKKAAKDEIRHARVTARLARQNGGCPTAPCVASGKVRSLAQIAHENAVEGCVRETFGALLATWQSKAAGDPHIRAAMRAIARDETAHAALAWDVAGWIEPRLAPSTRACIARARREALAALETDLAAPLARAIEEQAGVPSRDRARALLDGVREVLAA
jgi:hypothetical protein